MDEVKLVITLERRELSNPNFYDKITELVAREVINSVVGEVLKAYPAEIALRTYLKTKADEAIALTLKDIKVDLAKKLTLSSVVKASDDELVGFITRTIDEYLTKSRIINLE